MACQFCESSAPDHSWCDCIESIQHSEELSARKAEYDELTTSAEAFTYACFEFGESQYL